MVTIVPVTGDFAVSPQLQSGDFAAAAAAGYRLIVNNRPDGEAADQLPSTAARQAAADAGLAYVAIPVAGGPTLEAVAAMAAALHAANGPALAYCRSGTRSITLWALAQAQMGARAPAEIIALAGQAGYDLSHLGPTLARLQAASA